MASAAVVIVLDAADVVFARITAGQHLDQCEIDLTGIFQAVTGAIST